MGASIRQRMAQVAESALRETDLTGFELAQATDSHSICRFRRHSDTSTQEILIYPGKHYRKNGGNVYVDLYCIHHDFNRTWGIDTGSWLDGDEAWRAKVFQYRLSTDAADVEFLFNDNLDQYRDWLTRFLRSEATSWFLQFDTSQGIELYLRRECDLYGAAAWLSHQGKRHAAQDTFTEYLSTLPRQIDTQLDDAEQRGFISHEDKAYLRKASLQHEEDYRARVKQWVSGR